ncbi:hypothetical protein ATERTT37_006657 [Aspergillus terreus]
MALFPDVQRKAQEEMDRVTGGNRLPSYEDRENLPYINAMIKESVRWHSVVPMNVAHVSIQDDSVGEYAIPKGTQIVTNLCKPVRDGKEVEVKLDPQPGIICHPAPVELDIKPRNQVIERLIRAVETDYPWEKSHAELLTSLPY